ncbi:hypothetical protein ACFL9S_09485 [Erwinia sp. AnSW2-5]|uniref:hypothetical protein n=1 Tax=Erwinia sp. AnSW2-5 TaxID=3367692 RepID=UPI003859D252
MSTFIRIVFIIFYLVSMMVIYLSTVDKYDFIYDMEPTIHRGSLIDNSNNGNVFAGFTLFFIFLLQIAFIYFEKSKKWRWATGMMTVAACLFFFIR